MTSHLDSCTTTDIKPDMLSGVQTGNGIPHVRYNIRGIAHVRTNRKDDIFVQRRLGQIFIFMGQGTCKKSRLYPARAYTTLVVLVLTTNQITLEDSLYQSPHDPGNPMGYSIPIISNMSIQYQTHTVPAPYQSLYTHTCQHRPL